ncbi:hypothetical protein NEOKW01_0848 [Nematocida sp. AWRm80]|nr:hypothetical protein NEOKW01_0848 [Nematocida sp. AWRm80]
MKKVIVQYLQESIEIEVEENKTIDELKIILQERLGVPVDRQRLTLKGSVLSDGTRTIESIEDIEEAVIFLNRIEKIEGPREIAGEVYPKQELRPEMKAMKDSGIKKIFSNPEIMKGILDMFPEMKKENPELKKLMESTQMLEEMAKLAEDPEYMNTQMKNVDIAMAKLETIPGGFNMLRSMLKTQKDPNAGLAESTENSHFKEGSTITKDKGRAAPNPWGSTTSFNPLLEYRKQVGYMKECGFKNISMNIRMLIKHHGDVDNAISEILSTPMHSPVSDPQSRS